MRVTATRCPNVIKRSIPLLLWGLPAGLLPHINAQAAREAQRKAVSAGQDIRQPPSGWLPAGMCAAGCLGNIDVNPDPQNRMLQTLVW